MARNLDKIQLPTNITDISMLAVLLRAVKNNEPLTTQDSKPIFEEAKKDGKRKKASNGDTHTEKALYTYGLIKYIGRSKNTFVVTPLGDELLSIYNDDGELICDEKNFVKITLKVFAAWFADNKGRYIHPGQIIMKLLCDADVEGYLTEQEVAHFVYNPTFKFDNQYEEIKEYILDFRRNCLASPYTKTTKSYIFLPSLVNNWHILEKKSIETLELLKDGTVQKVGSTIVNTEEKYVNSAENEDYIEENEDILTEENIYKTLTKYCLTDQSKEIITASIDKYVSCYKKASKSTQSDLFTPEWFKEESLKYSTLDAEAEQMLAKFYEQFSPESLRELSGKELLISIFLNNENPDNLCRIMEYDTKNKDFFGSIAGGNAHKYGLYFSSDGEWVTGSTRNPQSLTEDEAMELGAQLRDYLIAGVETIRNFGKVETIEDYRKLYNKLKDETGGHIDRAWFMKYYYMMFPHLLASSYTDSAQRKVLSSLKLKQEKYAFVRMGQIKLYADTCEISNVMFNRIFWNNYEDDSVGEERSDEVLQTTHIPFDYTTTKNEGINKIFYGVPGCGKSYYIENVELKDFEEENRIRTTFYQDYSNTDFVGQILPKIIKGKDGDKDTVEYIFNPGPFTLALIQAVSNPTKKVALVVEEINRGNAPAIFGDIFQLLDRDDDCISEYGIVNVGVLDYLNSYEFTIDGEKKKYIFNEIKIPGNMYIYATMNTSDQNVYTLDTAFTRRWSKERIENKFGTNEIKNMYVPGMTSCTWGTFVDKVNMHIRSKIDELQVNEDKQVGCFFVKKSDLLVKDEADDKKAKAFAYKVLEYLWDDVSKLDHSVIFAPHYTTFEDLVKNYLEKGVEVFNGEIFK